MKRRLDQSLVRRGLTATRSQAESYIRLGKVTVGDKVQRKPGFLVGEDADVKLTAADQYVSRAGMKLASVAETFGLEFRSKTVLDVGSSTGGFTDYALQHGAAKVFAVDVGTNQLHPSLRGNPKIELHENTDIRNVVLESHESGGKSQEPKKIIVNRTPDIIVIDVSFISLRDILPHVSCLMSRDSELIAMVKPQFEATADKLKHKGVIKNERMRRDVLKNFEDWARQRFIIVDKADSGVAGEKGNLERFYRLRIAKV